MIFALTILLTVTLRLPSLDAIGCGPDTIPCTDVDSLIVYEVPRCPRWPVGEWWSGCYAPERIAAFGVRGREGQWFAFSLPGSLPFGTAFPTTRDRAGNESCNGPCFTVGQP